MLICILTKNVITSCSVTMMLFLHLEVKPLMTLTTVIRGFTSKCRNNIMVTMHEVITFSLQAAYANLHTDQERDYFMQRYHDVISSFGGKTSYDADNRPLLVMRSNLWASGYDVDGT